MPDSHQTVRHIYECNVCSALTPDYSIERKLTTSDQVTFHECMWEKADRDALLKDLQALKGVVNLFKPYLGDPEDAGCILEVGAGRGGMLKALRESGYNAYGCEPASGLVSIARDYYSLSEDILVNMDLDKFLSQAAKSEKYSSIIMWHVLEHVDSPISVLKRLSERVEPDGTIIIQVPLLKSNYIYPEHYYFVSHSTIEYLAKSIEYSLKDISYDEENMFVTCVFANCPGESTLPFLGYDTTPDAFSQLILLTERSRAAYKNFSDEQARAHSELVDGHRQVVKERDETIAALERLAQERFDVVQTMEVLIRDGQDAAEAQAKIIEQRDETIAALERLAQERFDMMQTMEVLIRDGQDAAEAQARMIEQREETIAALERLAQERFDAMEKLIRDGRDAVGDQQG